MADLKKLAKSRSGAVLDFDPTLIIIDPARNARDMTTQAWRDRVRELADGMHKRKYMRNRPIEIVGEGEKVYVTKGFTRLSAVLLANSEGAGIETVPCLPEAKGTAQVERDLDQITDNDGSPLSLFEAGKMIKLAIAQGWTVDDIARYIGKSRSFVDQALGFQAAPVEVLKAVNEGVISSTLAMQISRDNAPATAVAIVAEAVEVAKAAGKKKVTQKVVDKVVATPPAHKKASATQGKPDTDLTIKGGSLGLSVQFGDRTPIVLPVSAWKELAAKIVAAVNEGSFSK